MKPLDRDTHILEHIVSYCQQIEETVARFGNDGSIFSSDPIYRNAAALCILQRRFEYFSKGSVSKLSLILVIISLVLTFILSIQQVFVRKIRSMKIWNITR